MRKGRLVLGSTLVAACLVFGVGCQGEQPAAGGEPPVDEQVSQQADEAVISYVIMDVASQEVVKTGEQQGVKAEPGSAIKPLLAAQLVDMAQVAWDSSVSDEPFAVGDLTVKCWAMPENHGEETFEASIVNQCHPPLVAIGTQLPQEALADLGQGLGVDFTDKDEVQIAKFFAGQEFALDIKTIAARYSEGLAAGDDSNMHYIADKIAQGQEAADYVLLASGKGLPLEGDNSEAVETKVILWPTAEPKFCGVLQYSAAQAQKADELLQELLQSAQAAE